MQRETSDKALPSIYKLRLQAYRLIGSSQDTPLTVRELFTVGSITVEASPNPYDGLEEDLPGTIEPTTGHAPVLAHIIEEELDHPLVGKPHTQLTRMPVIFGWLSPHGLVSEYPTAVLRIARYLLSDTTQEEESRVDWVRARRLYPSV